MVRFFFWLVFAVGLFANNAAAQNPLKILDVFSGPKKESEKADNAPNLDAVPLTAATSSDIDEADEPLVPQVESVESVDNAGSTPPPFPAAEDSLKPAASKPAPKKDDAQEPGESEDQFEELPESVRVTPDSVPRNPTPPAVPANANPAEVTSATPVNPAPQVAAPLLSPARASSGNAYFGAIVDKEVRGRMGVEVASVTPNSPASNAGVRAGDVLITFAGSAITSREDFQQLIQLLSPGDRIELELIRDRRKARTLVTLADQAESLAKNANTASATIAEKQQIAGNQEIAPASDFTNPANSMVVPADGRLINQPYPANGSNQADAASQQGRLGIVVVDGIEETRNGFQRLVRTGAAVERVTTSSPAATSGIPVGALVVAANGRRIETANDLVSYINSLQPGDKVELAYFMNSQLVKVPVVLAPRNSTVQAQKPQANQQMTAANQPQGAVRQAADFQPVPGNNGKEAESDVVQPERPILDRLGERFPRLRRVETVIDNLSQQPQPAPQQAQRPAAAQQPRPEVLQQTIQQQQQQIEGLNRRLRELESRRKR